MAWCACRLAIGAVLAVRAAAPLGAQATTELRGKVVDPAGHAVAGAQLALSPGARREVSDEDGTFTFVGLESSAYTLSARRIGYQPARVAVVVGDAVTAVTITLVAIPQLLDSVRVREKTYGLRYAAVVLDQGDQPVPSAEVIAMGVSSDIVTDDGGHFSVGRLGKGTLVVRVRKMGYTPALASLRMLADRADTLRMTRLATSLTPVQIREASGYGRDYWAFRDMQQRVAWKSSMGGVISREELDARGKEDLCDALPATPTGAHLSLHNDPFCKSFPRGIKNILVGGGFCRRGLLSDFDADQVEMVEYMPTDYAGSLRAKKCGPPTYVIWLRANATRSP